MIERGRRITDREEGKKKKKNICNSVGVSFLIFIYSLLLLLRVTRNYYFIIIS